MFGRKAVLKKMKYSSYPKKTHKATRGNNFFHLLHLRVVLQSEINGLGRYVEPKARVSNVTKVARLSW